MEKLFYALWACIALSFGCSEYQRMSNLTFATQQPESGSDLKEFPKYLTGLYESPDGGWLVVTRDVIFHKTPTISNDTLDRNKSNSLQYTTDTIFKLNQDQVLRRLKKVYFLNFRTEKGWLVSRLEKKKHFLIMSDIADKEINQLKNLSTNHLDSIPYMITISPSNFMKFIRANGFSEADTFKLLK